MSPTRALAVVLLVATGWSLAACTDDTGAIDQEGHNGYDRRACTRFAAMANDVTHGALSTPQAQGAAVQLAGTSGHGGDPKVRRAGSDLADAYRAGDTRRVAAAMAEFRAACAW